MPPRKLSKNINLIHSSQLAGYFWEIRTENTAVNEIDLWQLPVNVAQTMNRMNSKNNLSKIEPHWCLVKQIIMPVNSIRTHSNRQLILIPLGKNHSWSSPILVQQTILILISILVHRYQ